MGVSDLLSDSCCFTAEECLGYSVPLAFPKKVGNWLAPAHDSLGWRLRMGYKTRSLLILDVTSKGGSLTALLLQDE